MTEKEVIELTEKYKKLASRFQEQRSLLEARFDGNINLILFVADYDPIQELYSLEDLRKSNALLDDWSTFQKSEPEILLAAKAMAESSAVLNREEYEKLKGKKGLMPEFAFELTMKAVKEQSELQQATIAHEIKRSAAWVERTKLHIRQIEINIKNVELNKKYQVARKKLFFKKNGLLKLNKEQNSLSKDYTSFMREVRNSDRTVSDLNDERQKIFAAYNLNQEKLSSAPIGDVTTGRPNKGN